MPPTLTIHDSFIFNDRLLFDCRQDLLTDLHDRSRYLQLKPISARLLRLMAASPRTVLGRRQLFDMGWRAFGFEVCDNSLNQVICALREAFAELAPGGTWIKTIPRIGYCLLADVRPMIDAAPAPHPRRRSTDRPTFRQTSIEETVG
jgi:DNA-binding winged helix-turn-helix (wHTH) protein